MATGPLSDKAKLRDRCVILVEVVRELGTIYGGEAVNDTQRHYLETIIGAALWYLPTSRELWTGAISVQALRDFHPDSGVGKPRLTEDHEYPRKVAAVELMKRSWGDEDSSGAMLQLYLGKYGRFNYITPRENKALVKHQKGHVFEQPAEAYRQAGIALVVITLSDLKQVRKRSRTVIEALSKSDSSVEKIQRSGIGSRTSSL